MSSSETTTGTIQLVASARCLVSVGGTRPMGPNAVQWVNPMGGFNYMCISWTLNAIQLALNALMDIQWQFCDANLSQGHQKTSKRTLKPTTDIWKVLSQQMFVSQASDQIRTRETFKRTTGDTHEKTHIFLQCTGTALKLGHEIHPESNIFRLWSVSWVNGLREAYCMRNNIMQ